MHRSPARLGAVLPRQSNPSASRSQSVFRSFLQDPTDRIVCANVAVFLRPAQPSRTSYPARLASIPDTHPASGREPQRPSRYRNGFVCSEQSSMRNCPPNDLAQHVAAAFVRRQHSVGNQRTSPRASGRQSRAAKPPTCDRRFLRFSLLFVAAKSPVNSAARLISGVNKSVS